MAEISSVSATLETSGARDPKIVPSSPLVKWWDMPLILTLSIVGSLILAVLGTIAYSAVTVELGVTAGGWQEVMSQPNFDAAAGIILYVLIAAIIVFITKKRKYDMTTAYFRPVSASYLWLGFGLALALGLSLFITEQFVSEEVTASFYTFYASTLARSGWSYLLLSGLIAAPLVEEMFFRGVVFTWWREKTNLVVAVIVSAAAFTLIHFYFLIIPGVAGWIASGQVFLFGVLAALLVIWTRSLWPSIVAHSTFNALAFGSLYFAL